MERVGEAGESRCFTDHMMHALFFSSAVYGESPDAVLGDLRQKFGNVVPLMHHGFDGKGQQAIFVARSVSGHVIVACRGTSSLKDVLQDLKYFHSRLPYAQGAAHWGFAERAQSVPVELFRKLLESGELLIFTGHSLGGAVASLLSLRVLKMMGGSFEQQVRCITFGAPLFASPDLAEVINLHYKDVFFHVVGKKDFVPKLLPVVSALQAVIYGHEDYLEGLSVLGKAVSILKWLPFAPMIQGLEKAVPLPIKLLVRCFMKLALPSTSWTYAFAGHVVLLDVEEKGPEDLLKVTCTDSLNLWQSQLNFACAIGFDAFTFMQHTTATYEHGVMRALSRALSRHKLGSSSQKLSFQADATMFRAEKDCSNLEDVAGGREESECREQECRHIDMGSSGRHDGPSCSNFISMPPGLWNQQGRNSLQSASSEHSSRRESLPSCTEVGTCEAILVSDWRWPRNRTERLRLRKCWEYPVVDRYLLENCQATSRMTSCDVSAVEGHITRCSSHCGRDGSSLLALDTDGSGCRGCASLQAYRAYGSHSRTRALVPRKGFSFGCVLKTIGRCSRHLRALDKLCYFTFIRMFLSHILG